MDIPKAARRIYKQYNTATIISDSMEPKLKIGDTVQIISGKKPEIGDIICYVSGKTIVCHRYYFSLRNLYFSKGDKSFRFDMPWDKKGYLGKIDIKVTLIERIQTLLIILKFIPTGLLWLFKSKNLNIRRIN